MTRWLFSTLLLSGIACSFLRAQESVKIWYIPYQIETITAVTSSNISKNTKIRTGFSKAQIEKILKIIQQAHKVDKNKFRDGRVRAKLKNGTKIYVIDAEGNCISNTFPCRRIDWQQLAPLLSAAP